MPLAQAIHEAQEANVVVANAKVTRTLAERLQASGRTVNDLLKRMPTNAKPATLKGRLYYDRVIAEKFGTREAASIKTDEISDMIEEIKTRGKIRWAQAIRTRLRGIFAYAVAIGWVEKNPANVTLPFKSIAKRGRLTFETYQLIYAKAAEVSPWLQNVMLLALVSGQDRSTVAKWERGFSDGTVATVHRNKTDKDIAIPLALRLDVLGVTLGEVIARCKSSNIATPYLIHHTENRGGIKRGAPIHLQTISMKFAEARKLAEIPDENAPSFHELRSLSKRLYDAQGNVDTKALLGHSTEQMSALYANSRGAEPVRVRIDVR